MAQLARTSLVFLLLIAPAASAWAQQAQPAVQKATLGKAIGKLVVDGTPSLTTTTIFVSSEVETDDVTHANVINRGNTLVFTPRSSFRAMRNAFKLRSGGSKVATYTGMTAHLPNCFSVTPVRPDYMTLFEVDWSGEAAIIYARSQDVRINYWAGSEPDADTNPDPNPRGDREWIVKEGHTARIRDVKLCKPLIDFWPEPNLPTALELAGTSAFVSSIPFWSSSSKPNMSSEGP